MKLTSITSRPCLRHWMAWMIVWYGLIVAGHSEFISVGERVNVMAIQTDGKVLVAGPLVSIAGEPCSNLARLNADGTLDTSFKPAVDLMPYALAVQADGKILVGGTSPYLVRLNIDGTVDASFTTQPDDSVYSLALQPDGRVLVGGFFQNLGGEPRKYLARINIDGGLDPSFNADTLVEGVSVLAVQPDGKILIGGSGLARLNSDGSPDQAFHPSASDTEYVVSVGVQADGKILFANDGAGHSGIFRLLPDGSPDPAFDPPIVQSPFLGMELQANGKILAAGDFLVFDEGEVLFNLWRLGEGGSLERTFPPTMFDKFVLVALAQSGDGIWIAGDTGGATNTVIQRLQNNEPSYMTLSFDGSVINWMQDGGGPQVLGATFERSTNGVDWTVLGVGVPISGGWRLTSAGLSPGDMVRARGLVSSMTLYSASWLVEATGRVGDLVILAQPEGRTNTIGTTAGFAVSVSGDEPISYQWLKDGANIPGATDGLFVLTNVQPVDAGSYEVAVSNSFGKQISSGATLVISLAPQILVQPTSWANAQGATVRFNVSAAGSEPLTYQWLKDGTNLPGRTERILVLTNIQPTDARRILGYSNERLREANQRTCPLAAWRKANNRFCC